MGDICDRGIGIDSRSFRETEALEKIERVREGVEGDVQGGGTRDRNTYVMHIFICALSMLRT